jgi:hypothetical protein
MTQARDCDSRVRGRMLDYSIRDYLAHSISSGFYDWTATWFSIMVSESRGIEFEFWPHIFRCA